MSRQVNKMKRTKEEIIAAKLERKKKWESGPIYKGFSSCNARVKAFDAKISYKEVSVDISEKQDGSMMRTISKKRPIKFWFWVALMAVVLLICFLSIKQRTIRFTWSAFFEAFASLFTPSPLRTKTIAGWWAYSWNTFTTSFWHLFEICFLGTLLGSLISIPVYYLCARNVTSNPWIRTPVRLINDLIRTIPMFLVGLLISQIFSIANNIDGVLTIAVFTIGIMYQMMYEFIETLEMSPFEAIRASGGRSLQNVNLGLHPEVKPMFFAYFIYTLEINIRASVILSYVGFGGYITILQDNISAGYFDYAGSMLLPLLLVVAALQFISNWMVRKLR
jgi:phosphonate transport system permease protein